MIKYTLKIIDIIDEAEGTKTYYFEKPEVLKWEEGSHAHIAHVGFDVGIHPKEDWVRHMSIMTLPEENKLGITTRISGSVSEFKKRLLGLKIGDEVAFFKFGSRMGLRRINKPVVLLSMGVGIATMRPLILSFTNDNSNIPHMINMNIDSSGNFVYKDELSKLECNNYKNYWMESRKEFYEKLQQLAEAEDAIYYAVGSNPFLEECIAKLRENKVENMNIIIDKKGEALERLLGTR